MSGANIVRKIFATEEITNKKKETKELKEAIITILKNYKHFEGRFKFVTTLGAVMINEQLTAPNEEIRNIYKYMLNFMRIIENEQNDDIKLLINFEHVCFVISLLLINRLDATEDETRNIYCYFLYSLKNDNVLHNLKALREYYICKRNKADILTNCEFKKTFNPTTYLDIRLTSGTNDVLSMFSLQPPTKINNDIDIIWFCWEQPNSLTLEFTKIYEDIVYYVFIKKRNKLTIQSAFEYLTCKDIKPRTINNTKSFYKLENIHYLDDEYDVLKNVKGSFRSMKNNKNSYLWNKIKDIEIGASFVKNRIPTIKGLGENANLSFLSNSFMLSEIGKHKIVRKLTEYRPLPKGIITIEHREGTINFMKALKEMNSN